LAVSALHGHFVDLYGSFKLRIRNLSQVDTKVKCPVEYKVDDEGCIEYVEALNNLLSSDAKKYNSKKWWSRGVVELLLEMHLEQMLEFGSGKQSAGWLAEKAKMHKTKFETDQKNRLDDLAKKRKAEEDERKDAARFRQTVSAASKQLVEAFKNFTTPPAQAETVGAMVEKKMATMKTEIMQEIGAKMEENSKEGKDTLASILDLLRNKN
jgi:signal recognition particle subunit SEC65